MNDSARNCVLIVDDSDVLRTATALALESNFTIIEAKNGYEAIELAKKHCGEIGVILLDLIMPELSGLDVLKYLKQLPEVQNIPVMIITTDENKENEDIGIELGVSDYIHKPFSPAVLNRRVKNQIELYNYRFPIK